MNYGLKVLLENAKTFEERRNVVALTEGEISAVNNAMVTNLYKSAIEKAHIDFDDIPNSKGDVTRYSGYNSMREVITILRELSSKNNVVISELDTVETALNNIVAFRESFERGFMVEKDFVVLQYCVLVYACVESTSIIISSYVDFIKRVDREEFTLLKGKDKAGGLCIENLTRFNQAVSKGEYSKVMNNVLENGKEGFLGVDDVLVPVAIVGAVLLIVPLIRELIFAFYYSRMKVSDYLEQQALFLEINSQNVQASSTLSTKRKTEVLKKQSSYVTKLRSMSDKIKVQQKLADTEATKKIASENKSWTIDEVKTQGASIDNTGFKLL